MKQNKEIWKPVVGFEGMYEVSNMGNVRSLNRVVIKYGRKVTLKGKQLSPAAKLGYKFVNLYKNSKGSRRNISRLVAEAFIPNPKNKPQVDHINTIRDDNRVENLRWVTQKENMNNPITRQNHRDKVYIDSTKHKILSTRKERDLINKEKTVYQYTIDGVYIASYKSVAEASRITGVDAASIGNVCRRGRGGKSAGGFIWLYIKEDNVSYNPYPDNHKFVYRYDINGSYIDTWYSVAEAERVLGIKNISRCARGAKQCKAGGYWWKYYKTENIFN